MTTYDDLIAYAATASYAGNRDMTDELPRLVRRAQNYLVLHMDHDLFADEVIETTINVDGMVDKSLFSTEFLDIRKLMVKGRGDRPFPLLPRAENMLETLYASGKPGTPIYYARLRDREYKVYPAPYRPLDAILRVNVRPPMLGTKVQTNILTDYFSEAFEFALLREVAVFNIDQPQVQLYTAELQDRLTSANVQVSRLTRDETSQRPTETRNVTGS